MVSRVRPPTRRRRPPPRGSVLLLALVLLAVIGLASASSMHQALAEEKTVTSLRLEAQAQQYAELALKYCEAQLALPPTSRIPSLHYLESVPPVADINSGKWATRQEWNGAIGLPADLLGSSDSSTMPPAPQCLAERLLLGTTAPNVAYLVTARAFSPGFQAAAASGQVIAGSVVWLQSILAIN